MAMVVIYNTYRYVFDIICRYYNNITIASKFAEVVMYLGDDQF
jgi:hypothetical protein